MGWKSHLLYHTEGETQDLKNAYDSASNHSFKNAENIDYSVKNESNNKLNANSGYDFTENKSHSGLNEPNEKYEDS